MMAKLQTKAVAFLNDFKNDERGVTAIEYGLIAAAMAAALTVIFGDSSTFISALKGLFSGIASSL
ncbi:Flp family type IVb pilin [Vibrio maritimus]|uniref:Flp family type IVb pilin n=1 Tax=Vibrio maritimus TaxID=990268 RepID=UPI001F1EBF6A|nr:Flp family type IVb pilin [Vibrio maritimus]